MPNMRNMSKEDQLNYLKMSNERIKNMDENQLKFACDMMKNKDMIK